ncbi:hypothetical protein TYM08_P0005 [Marinicellulosiphila megalodicopiae]
MNIYKYIGVLFLITYSQFIYAENGNNASYKDQFKNKIVEFDDREYKLAWESNKNSTVAKEFVTGNETLSNWTTLISIRKFMSLEMNKVIPLYLKKIGNYLTDKPKFFKNKHIIGRHVFIENLLTPKNEEYTEYNLVLFVEKHDGVFMYQYSEKIPRNGSNKQAQALDVIMNAMTDLL